MKTVVIGGGISGLSAAYTLQKNNVDFVLLEAGKQTGGRTSGTEKEGFRFDNGAIFLMRNYTTVKRLVRELSLEAEVVKKVPLRAADYIDGDYVPMIPDTIREALFTHPARLLHLRKIGFSAFKGLFTFYYHAARRKEDFSFSEFDKALDIDRQNFEQWVLKYGNKKALDYFLQPVIGGMTLDNVKDLSALYGVKVSYESLLGFWCLKNGICSLADRLYEEVKPGVQLNTPVRKIATENNKIKGVETENGFIDADAVIPAVTATTLRGIFPDMPEHVEKILRKVQYSPTWNVFFAYDRKFLPDDINFLAMPLEAGSSMAMIMSSDFFSETRAPEGCSLIQACTYEKIFSGKHGKISEKEVAERLKDEIRRYVPSAPAMEPIFTKVIRWEEAMCFPPPGWYTAISKIKKANGKWIEGVYFAGDYLNLSSVEGSARSGVEAAESVIADMRRM